MTNSLVALYDRDSGFCATVDHATRSARAEVTAQALTLAGVRPRDTVQVTSTIDASGAAWHVLWALDLLDTVVVATSGLTATPALRQFEFLRRFGVTTLCADEVVLDALAGAAREEGADLAVLPVQRILLTTPAPPASHRRELEDAWNAAVFCVYASRSAPMWAAAECDASCRAGGSLGLHVLDDVVLGEVDQGVRLLTDPCPCGLVTSRVLFETED